MEANYNILEDLNNTESSGNFEVLIESKLLFQGLLKASAI